MRKLIILLAALLASVCSVRSQNNNDLKQFADQICTYLGTLNHYKVISCEFDPYYIESYLGVPGSWEDQYTIVFTCEGDYYYIDLDNEFDFRVSVNHEIGIYRTLEDVQRYTTMMPPFADVNVLQKREDFDDGTTGYMLWLYCEDEFAGFQEFKTIFPTYMRKLREVAQYVADLEK